MIKKLLYRVRLRYLTYRVYCLIGIVLSGLILGTHSHFAYASEHASEDDEEIGALEGSVDGRPSEGGGRRRGSSESREVEPEDVDDLIQFLKASNSVSAPSFGGARGTSVSQLQLSDLRLYASSLRRAESIRQQLEARKRDLEETLKNLQDGLLASDPVVEKNLAKVKKKEDKKDRAKIAQIKKELNGDGWFRDKDNLAGRLKKANNEVEKWEYLFKRKYAALSATGQVISRSDFGIQGSVHKESIKKIKNNADASSKRKMQQPEAEQNEIFKKFSAIAHGKYKSITAELGDNFGEANTDALELLAKYDAAKKATQDPQRRQALKKAFAEAATAFMAHHDEGEGKWFSGYKSDQNTKKALKDATARAERLFSKGSVEPFHEKELPGGGYRKPTLVRRGSSIGGDSGDDRSSGRSRRGSDSLDEKMPSESDGEGESGGKVDSRKKEEDGKKTAFKKKPPRESAKLSAEEDSESLHEEGDLRPEDLEVSESGKSRSRSGSVVSEHGSEVSAPPPPPPPAVVDRVKPREPSVPRPESKKATQEELTGIEKEISDLRQKQKIFETESFDLEKSSDKDVYQAAQKIMEETLLKRDKARLAYIKATAFPLKERDKFLNQYIEKSNEIFKLNRKINSISNSTEKIKLEKELEVLKNSLENLSAPMSVIKYIPNPTDYIKALHAVEVAQQEFTAEVGTGPTAAKKKKTLEVLSKKLEEEQNKFNQKKQETVYNIHNTLVDELNESENELLNATKKFNEHQSKLEVAKQKKAKTGLELATLEKEITAKKQKRNELLVLLHPQVAKEKVLSPILEEDLQEEMKTARRERGALAQNVERREKILEDNEKKLQKKKNDLAELEKQIEGLKDHGKSADLPTLTGKMTEFSKLKEEIEGFEGVKKGYTQWVQKHKAELKVKESKLIENRIALHLAKDADLRRKIMDEDSLTTQDEKAGDERVSALKVRKDNLLQQKTKKSEAQLKIENDLAILEGDRQKIERDMAGDREFDEAKKKWDLIKRLSQSALEIQKDPLKNSTHEGHTEIEKIKQKIHDTGLVNMNDETQREIYNEVLEKNNTLLHFQKTGKNSDLLSKAENNVKKAQKAYEELVLKNFNTIYLKTIERNKKQKDALSKIEARKSFFEIRKKEIIHSLKKDTSTLAELEKHLQTVMADSTAKTTTETEKVIAEILGEPLIETSKPTGERHSLTAKETSDEAVKTLYSGPTTPDTSTSRPATSTSRSATGP